jgi:long-chain acyl-CoA synthetase
VAPDTIPTRLFERARATPYEPAYFVRERGSYRARDWATYAEEVRETARALLASGIAPEQCVAMVAGNRREWSLLMLAAMCIGARGVGIYTTSSSDDVQTILTQTEARLVLVDTPVLRERVRHASRGELTLITAGGAEHDKGDESDETSLGFARFLERARTISDGELDERLAAITPQTVASIVYSSGAEGVPQGAMLSHRNLIWTAERVAEILDIGPSDTLLSYLPLAHVSEQLLTVHGPLCTGSIVYYAESARSTPGDLREVQPTVLFGVPRIWEKLQSAIEARIAKLHGARARLVTWARGVATRIVQARCEGKLPSIELAAQYELANSLVLDKLRSALGLGRARVCIAGAAAIREETLAFYASMGIQLLEAYGQTECSGPICMNQPQRARFGSAGPKLPGLQLSIASDGELLVSGPSVFVGYYKNARGTAEALADGVLHTGDLGELDNEGFLTISGRKREILVTAGGKSISPKRIEAALGAEELVRDVVVVGDGRRFLCALFTVDVETATTLGLRGDLHDNEIVRERIARKVSEVNARLGSAEQIRRFLILPRQLSVETGELTPTGKLKRARIEELWAQELEVLYAEGARPEVRA